MMTKIRSVFTASAALLALVSAPALYAQGKGNDKAQGGGPSAQQPERGNSGGGQGSGGNAGKGKGNAPGASGRDAPGRAAYDGPARPGKPQQAAQSGDARGQGPDNRGQGNSASGNRGANAGRNGAALVDRGALGKIGGAGGYALRELRDTFGSRPRLIDGCPPGLAQKRNGCLPPGLARSQYRSFDPGFFGLYGADSGRYFFQDGYLLRYRTDGLAGFLPLLGGALGIGNIWPASYQTAPLPDYYSDYYRLGDDRSYRYADNVIYRVNPQTSAITSIAGLLTGDDFAIGQPMPRGYDVYNVPMAYRDRYADTPDARYRYANGYVYEIDPATSLIQSVIALVL